MLGLKLPTDPRWANIAEKNIDEIFDYLCDIAEMSLDGKDFSIKVSQGLTDETSTLSEIDLQTLETWYYQTYLEM